MAAVGSSLKYARVHDEGFGNIPQREYLHINDKALEHIVSMMAEVIVKDMVAA